MLTSNNTHLEKENDEQQYNIEKQKGLATTHT